MCAHEGSYVNLTNRSAAFQDWLEFEASPLVAGRFINHLNVGSTMLWTNSWSGERLSGSVSLQSSWGGWLGQTVAERLTQDPSRFHPETGAWMVREDVPLVQHQRHLVQVHLAPRVRRAIRWSPHVRIQAGWAGVGANTVSLPLEHSFVSGGANGIRGWRLGSWGLATSIRERPIWWWKAWATFNSCLPSNGVPIGCHLGTSPGSLTQETFGCMGQTHQLRQDGVTRDGAAWPWVLAWASATTLKSWCCAWTRDCACTTLCKSRGSGGWVKDHGAARCTLGWGCHFDRYPRRGGEFREQLNGSDRGRDAHPCKFAAWDGSRETPKASPLRARRRKKFLKAVVPMPKLQNRGVEARLRQQPLGLWHVRPPRAHRERACSAAV